MNERLFAFLFWGGLAFILINTWAFQAEKDRPPTPAPYVSPRPMQPLPQPREILTDQSGTQYSCRDNGGALICQ